MSSIIKVNTIQDAGGNALLTSDGSGTLTTNNIGGQNTPAFRATLTNQTVATNTNTKLQFDTEDIDTDNCYDATTNYRFTPNVAGKYFIMASVNHDMGGDNFKYSYLHINKNGTTVAESFKNKNNNYNNEETDNVYTIVTMNGTTDYVEAFAEGTTNNSGNFTLRSRNGSAQFIGYKLIGV